MNRQETPHIVTINNKLQYRTLYNRVRHDQFLQILSNSDEKGLLVLHGGAISLWHFHYNVQIGEPRHTVYTSHGWRGMLLGGNYSL